MDSSRVTTVISTPLRASTMVLSLITICVLSWCLTRRLQRIKSWRKMTLTNALVVIVYVDSFLFVFSTTVLSKVWSLNSSSQICDAAILLCLTCYTSTKVLIYYFLVEKVYIIRGSYKPRLKSRLWCFNVFGVICPYAIVIVINFYYRIAYINKEGTCIIGMERKAIIPLDSFEVVLNIYLNALFLQPLRQMYSFKHKTNANAGLRKMATRTFVGSCTTLVFSVTNITYMMIANGEPGSICLTLCNIDVLCSVLVLHWATSVDRDDDAPKATSYTASSTAVNASSSRANTTVKSYVDLELNDFRTDIEGGKVVPNGEMGTQSIGVKKEVKIACQLARSESQASIVDH